VETSSDDVQFSDVLEMIHWLTPKSVSQTGLGKPTERDKPGRLKVQMQEVPFKVSMIYCTGYIP
jgi:hypothetical protein